MNNTCKDVVIAGDYNINLLKIQEVPHFLDFFEFMANHSFYPKITLPTRLAKYSSSLIDNYYCKISQNLLISECGILYTRISDHLPYFINIKGAARESPSSQKIKLRLNSNVAKSNLLSDLLSCNIADQMDRNLLTDPNKNYDILCDQIQALKNKHLPHRYVKANKHRHKGQNGSHMGS